MPPRSNFERETASFAFLGRILYILLTEEMYRYAMQPHDTLSPPTEAAVLTGLPLKAVNNAIDKKTVSAVAGEDAGRPTRLLDPRAPVSLSLERRLADRIAPELRRKVFDALAESPRNVVSLEGGWLKIDLREPRREL